MKLFRYLAFATAFVSVCSLLQSKPGKGDDVWIPLFNSKDLSGWTANENKDSCKVEDGQIVLFGPRSHLFYTGDANGGSFTDFELKLEVMTTKGSNSGVYFHTKYQKKGWPNKGYEAQVNNTHGDPKKTGGLYGVKDNFKAPAKDGEWFDYHIIVKGKRIQLKINGKTITDYTEPDGLKRPNRQLDKGTFCLQAHDPKSKVFFRNIRVKPGKG
ncbi:MAG: DUF1080 domain-containing protein [Opitutales bacterium]|nr:DUF1080 domain-containing protein [Opitutales bacterium]